MSIALHGNLRDFGIAEVFQLIGQQRKTGTLVVGEGARSILLVFDEGRVVRGGPAGATRHRRTVHQPAWESVGQVGDKSPLDENPSAGGA